MSKKPSSNLWLCQTIVCVDERLTWTKRFTNINSCYNFRKLRKRDNRIKQLEMKDKQREVFVKRTTEEMNRLRRQQRTPVVSDEMDTVGGKLAGELLILVQSWVDFFLFFQVVLMWLLQSSARTPIQTGSASNRIGIRWERGDGGGESDGYSFQSE